IPTLKVLDGQHSLAVHICTASIGHASLLRSGLIRRKDCFGARGSRLQPSCLLGADPASLAVTAVVLDHGGRTCDDVLRANNPIAPQQAERRLRCHERGLSRSVAMQLTRHKTEAVYRRSAITYEADLREGVERLNDAVWTNRGYKSGNQARGNETIRVNR